MKERLKNRRIELGYTQREIAKKLGIPYQVYQRYENGKVIPNAIMTCKIAKALQTTAEELYGED